MEWSWLLVLVCPLMMIFMMFGMKGTHAHGHGHGRGQALHSNVDQGVQQQLSELREQNEQLRKEVDKLSRNSM
ncbi:DUF2933 domain-containing protein [Paenibacillus lutimineralis]|uniref:DUF2933 domain-containing protein n=1 Tax=Paenibacillus lutimineralis TaxID=2707005 RepID=A0A3S9V1T6_9BACL|nr:DUF2933 domain-containing protein [Paenibacillus lutimineralis]AZS16531.1 DUF2933 domain-containing protein [Paenibacillus lutimineralis]